MRLVLCLCLFLNANFLFAETTLKPSCDPKACTAEKPVCKKGESPAEIKSDAACCPHFVCRSNRPRAPKNCAGAVCTAVMPICSQGQEAVNKASDGACCPNWGCVEKK